ncbi:ACT domain-containing protein ACR8-like [Zingiber officinale]|uniref:ACT domain-containing protein ACR n=1 Tax=Zingiber officinale TaxID=94328 RepID=A0A8J5KAR4_ZINOF|nr:ACT domain-containing protein ACR8-like [Zingiber officinale]KAG6475546.1 hypothetical protein ZIOFF_064774 [Zingiber officinale]
MQRTYTTVFSACARLADLDREKRVYELLITSGFELDDFISSSIVDMYAKCGNLETARDVFEQSQSKSAVSWNSIITGVSSTATVVSVNNARNSVLDTVRVLTDLNLSIQKGYISFDGCWFLDVFHVTDERGHKILDPVLLSHIEHSIVVGEISSTEEGATSGMFLALELTGVDRPGLLSEVCAVLRDLKCNVVEAKMWAHSARIACLIFVNDHHSGLIPTALADRHPCILTRLRKVLSGSAAKATVVSSSPTLTHSDRRLHQLMFRDRCDDEASSSSSSSQSKPSVSVQRLAEHGYSVVNVQCPDRPKLLFDVVCTLTDMDYVVFHGKFGVDADRAFQWKLGNDVQHGVDSTATGKHSSVVESNEWRRGQGGGKPAVDTVKESLVESSMRFYLEKLRRRRRVETRD